MLPKEAFLSHASADSETAEKIAGTLRRHGVPIWYSPSDILGAQQWHDEIGNALARCDWFLLVLTPAAVASVWVKRELVYALNDPRYSRILPMLIETCEAERLSWVLPSFQMIDFRSDFDRGCRQLLRTWGLGYSPPS
ncbi:MAG TPA: toll/interleukin-1 receptor domain-containing protein [Longimicrobium sp.]|nr:toll/interleukin-1 receptor domain-containing protein [Longimicrobium sp.]